MGMAQLVVTAVLVEGRSTSEVAREYGLSRRWVITLVQRFLAEGQTGLEPRSRRPADELPGGCASLRAETRESRFIRTSNPAPDRGFEQGVTVNGLPLSLDPARGEDSDPDATCEGQRPWMSFRGLPRRSYR